MYTDIVGHSEDALDDCVGFDWDTENSLKNWERHRVTPEEAEDVFFHEPVIIRGDSRHSNKSERRYYALGQTGIGRRLFVAFTIRQQRIRVISVRDMNRNESEIYGKHEKTNS